MSRIEKKEKPHIETGATLDTQGTDIMDQAKKLGQKIFANGELVEYKSMEKLKKASFLRAKIKNTNENKLLGWIRGRDDVFKLIIANDTESLWRGNYIYIVADPYKEKINLIKVVDDINQFPTSEVEEFLSIVNGNLVSRTTHTIE